MGFDVNQVKGKERKGKERGNQALQQTILIALLSAGVAAPMKYAYWTSNVFTAQSNVCNHAILSVRLNIGVNAFRHIVYS